MLVTGLSLETFRDIVTYVSNRDYNGNVIVQRDAYEMSPNRFRARLRVTDSHEHGARMSWSGRHMPAASWEAYRDVLQVLFDKYPNARVQTAHAVYRGREGFERDYPETAWVNVGSLFQPAYLRELSI